MKQQIKNWVAAALFTITGFVSFSQESQTEIPKWVSEKGYWVVESNNNDPLNHIIRFYSNDDVMIYKETLSGVRLNPNKKRVRMKLKKVLEISALAWEQRKVTEEEKQYVSAILK